VDLNSATGSLLGVVRAFVIFCTKEEGYPLETSTDDRCVLSSAISDGLVTTRLTRVVQILHNTALY